MGLPKLETGCFCFDLKTGNLIIGSLNTFFSFVMMVMMIVKAASFGSLENDKELVLSPESRAALTGAYALCVILCLMFVAKFLFDLLFIYGVSAEKAGIIKAYMIMWIVFFILQMFVFFINISQYGAGHIVSQVFYLKFNIYGILLSNSFYHQLNNREVV